MTDATLLRDLKGLYGRLLGKLKWSEAPPKTMDRASRNREAFEAGEKDRQELIVKIKTDLPHLLHVIHMLDPAWRPEDAKVVRPSQGWRKAPPGGWIGAAMAVLQTATDYLTIADIVEDIARRYDIDISHVADRQALHTTINNSLAKRRDLLVSDGGRPAAWALKSKVAP